MDRDISPGNVMMEGDKLCPDGWHHRDHRRAPDGQTWAKFFTRTQCPPKYCFIDFGLSYQYDPSEENPLELGVVGGDKTVPEFKTSATLCNPFHTSATLFNPFYTDIYTMGNLAREYFMEVRII